MYGTTVGGGSSGNGVVFAVNTNGTGFVNLYNFAATLGPRYTNRYGAKPYAELILSGNTLYGAALGGGSSGNGTVFGLSLPPLPQLAIILSGTNIVLKWPTNAAGFTLQSTTNLVSGAVWSAVSAVPIVIGGKNSVISPVSGKNKFFRLSQ